MASCNDFDGDGILTLTDVYIYYAWYQASQGRGAPANPNIAQTQAKYDSLYGASLPATVVNVPSTAPVKSATGTQYTDYDGDGVLSLTDVYIYYAWYQASQGRGAPANPNIAQTQAKYDSLYGASLPTTVHSIPELVCITPTPTPTPTPTHCYNHPDFVFNQTQGTYHCSIQGAIDVADDGDYLKLSADTTGTTYITYEQNILLDASKPKNLTIDGQNIWSSGYGSLIKGSNITIDSNAATLINLELSGCNITCTSTLSTTTVERCYMVYSQDIATNYSVNVNLTNPDSTFILHRSTLDSRLKTDPLSTSGGVNIDTTSESIVIISDNEIHNSQEAITITNGDCLIDSNDFFNNNLDVHLKDIPKGVMPSIRQNKFASTPTAVKITSLPTLAHGLVDMSYNYWGSATPTGRIDTPKNLPADTSPYYTGYNKSTLQA